MFSLGLEMGIAGVVVAVKFQFKGSGWYITDYAKKDSAAGKSDKPDSSGKSSDSDSKTETKSPEKTETKPATASQPASGDPKK